MHSSKTSTIGLIELPYLELFDSEGKKCFPGDSNSDTLISKQVLLSSLQAEGFDAQLVNLQNGNHREEYGKVFWGNQELTKVYHGTRIGDLDPLAYDAWGITNNFSQSREIACLTIQQLASKGRPVVVGGSDAIAEAQPYFAAGASAVVLDKSGAANGPIMDYVLGNTPREELSGVILKEGHQPPPRVRQVLSPQDWPLPDSSVIKQCLGTRFLDIHFPEERTFVGSVFSDIGCDRKCDFCQTPTYRLGYRAMSPTRVLQWFVAQKEAGAKTVMMSSDQFLGRIVRKGGRDEILEIMKGLRELGLAVMWNNGLELKKMTLGRGINRKDNTDFTPDEEIISALWGWDGKAGCYYGYVPAERPIFGRENYTKLLPWQEHCETLKAIVRTGVPYLGYGVVIGFSDDSDEVLLHLEEAIGKLYEELIAINPSVNFQILPYALLPIPGTPQYESLRQSGLIRFDDLSIFSAFRTPSADTHYLSYQEIADWRERLIQAGTPY